MDISDKKLSIQRARKHVHKPGYKFPVEKRIECVTKYLALGNLRLVSELTGVSYGLIREWRTAPWWYELEAEIKASRILQVDNKLSKIVDTSLSMVQDRLEFGDFVFNQKSGEVVRKPVSLRDATRTASDLMTRQVALHKESSENTTSIATASVADQLKLLADEFAKFNKRNTGPVEEAVVLSDGEHDAIYEEREEGLQEGSSTLYLEAGCEEKEGLAEQGEGFNGEEGAGS
jgi:hypothetical protein